MKRYIVALCSRKPPSSVESSTSQLVSISISLYLRETKKQEAEENCIMRVSYFVLFTVCS